MKIKETVVTETLLSQITEQVVSKETMMCPDADDVCKVIVGKSGIMYEVHHEGKCYSKFMKAFFNELVVKSQVKNSTNVLISINMDKNKPLMMEDMNIIHEFMEVFANDTDAIWGVSTNLSDVDMKLLVICTN